MKVTAAQRRADAILSRLGFENPKIAEIGVLVGRLSRRILARPDVHLTMVDSWLAGEDQPEAYRKSGDATTELTKDGAEFTRREAIRNTDFADGRRTIVHADSVVAAAATPDASLDLVFIDARHDLEGVREDIAAWWPKVKAGGWLSGHDYDNVDFPQWGVKQAVDEFAAERGLHVELDEDFTWFVQKPGPSTNDPSLWHKGELVVACVMVGDYEGRGLEYVQKLSAAVARNLREYPYRFVCFSDQPIPGTETHRVPSDATGWWSKLYMFAHLRDRRVLYLDLDTLVINDLEPFVEKLRGTSFAMLRDWYNPLWKNSAMMYWEGDHSDIWRRWNAEGRPTTFAENLGDQAWISKCRPDATLITELLPGKVNSYKAQNLEDGPPKSAHVVAFHGRPRPHECDNWVADFWKIDGALGKPRWTQVLNSTDDEILANIKANQARGLPEINECEPTDVPIALCCGGPSLKENLDALRALQSTGGVLVWAVNGVADYLEEQGIRVDAHVILDAREWNKRFVENSRSHTTYFLASQAHPAVFDAVIAQGRNVILWNAVFPGIESESPMVLGPATVGSKAICLAYVLGHRRMHIFGMDGSFRDGEHHAYSQPENDGQLTMEVFAVGRKFFAPRWGAKQTDDMMKFLPALLSAGCELEFVGDGLLQWCIKHMIPEEAANG